MKAFKFLPIVCAFAMFLSGCGGPAGRVKVAMGPTDSTTEVVAVDMFDAESPPDRPFREIAQLSYDGVSGEYFDVIREFKLKARELGADAIILDDPVAFTGSTQHFMYRATAIGYQDKGARAAR